MKRVEQHLIIPMSRKRHLNAQRRASYPWMAVLLWTLALTASCQATAGVAQGIAAFDRGDYTAAVREIKPHAVAGEARAEYLYGLMIASGKIPVAPGEKGLDWLERAAAHGDAKAQFQIALSILGKKDPPPAELQRAIEWLDKAAAQGLAKAKSTLASRLLSQDPLPKQDAARAVALYQQLAEQSDTNAMVELGQVLWTTSPYFDAVAAAGVKTGDDVAFSWFERAARRGDPAGQLYLARLYEKGRGVPKNDAMALSWYHRAAAQDDPVSQLKLNVLYRTGSGGAIKDHRKAFPFGLKAAQQDIPEAMLFTGMAYAYGVGIAHDLPKAYEWLTLAHARGEESAQRYLDKVAPHLSAAQRADALSRAAKWQPRQNEKLQREIRKISISGLDE